MKKSVKKVKNEKFEEKTQKGNKTPFNFHISLKEIEYPLSYYTSK